MEKDGRERQSHQMTRNQGRKKINPIVGDETETGEEGKADLRRGGEEEEEEFENGRGEESGWSGGDGGRHPLPGSAQSAAHS